MAVNCLWGILPSTWTEHALTSILLKTRFSLESMSSENSDMNYIMELVLLWRLLCFKILERIFQWEEGFKVVQSGGHFRLYKQVLQKCIEIFDSFFLTLDLFPSLTFWGSSHFPKRYSFVINENDVNYLMTRYSWADSFWIASIHYEMHRNPWWCGDLLFRSKALLHELHTALKLYKFLWPYISLKSSWWDFMILSKISLHAY